MKIALAIALIAGVALIASRFSNRAVDIALLVACVAGAVAWLVDDPQGFDYVIAGAFALVAVVLARELKSSSDSA